MCYHTGAVYAIHQGLFYGRLLPEALDVMSRAPIVRGFGDLSSQTYGIKPQKEGSHYFRVARK